jgi:hypothetical protein
MLEGIPCKMGVLSGRDSLTPMILHILYFWSMYDYDKFNDNYDIFILHNDDNFMTNSFHGIMCKSYSKHR